MSTKKLFTPEEVEILKENPYTWKVSLDRITYTAYAPLPGVNYVAFGCCHIIANEYCLSILFALLPYVVEEEALLDICSCRMNKNKYLTTSQ